MDKQKYFDLHIEIGLTTDGRFYAKTIISGSIVFRTEGPTPATATTKLAIELETAGLWSNMAQNPAMCSYPFPGPQTPLAVNFDPKAPKRLPTDLTQVAHPACQVQCSSYEHFKDAKCKSMCGQRRGL